MLNLLLFILLVVCVCFSVLWVKCLLFSNWIFVSVWVVKVLCILINVRLFIVKLVCFSVSGVDQVGLSNMFC